MFGRRTKFNETKWLEKKIAVYKDKCNSSTVIYTMIARNTRIFCYRLYFWFYVQGQACKNLYDDTRFQCYNIMELGSAKNEN